MMIPRQGNTRSYLRYLAGKQTGERYIICTYIYNIPPFALHLKSSTRRQIVSM